MFDLSGRHHRPEPTRCLAPGEPAPAPPSSIGRNRGSGASGRSKHARPITPELPEGRPRLPTNPIELGPSPSSRGRTLRGASGSSAPPLTPVDRSSRKLPGIATPMFQGSRPAPGHCSRCSAELPEDAGRPGRQLRAWPRNHLAAGVPMTGSGGHFGCAAAGSVVLQWFWLPTGGCQRFGRTTASLGRDRHEAAFTIGRRSCSSSGRASTLRAETRPIRGFGGFARWEDPR
jgi:hypothetical protein